MYNIKKARLIADVDGDFCAVIFEEGVSWAYWFDWSEEKGTFVLSFGSKEWEGLFKTTPLIRDYLDLVLSDLISYRQRVNRLFS